MSPFQVADRLCLLLLLTFGWLYSKPITRAENNPKKHILPMITWSLTNPAYTILNHEVKFKAKLSNLESISCISRKALELI